MQHICKIHAAYMLHIWNTYAKYMHQIYCIYGHIWQHVWHWQHIWHFMSNMRPYMDIYDNIYDILWAFICDTHMTYMDIYGHIWAHIWHWQHIWHFICVNIWHIYAIYGHVWIIYVTYMSHIGLFRTGWNKYKSFLHEWADWADV